MIGSTFFGRKYCLDILDKRVKAHKDGYRQNIAIIGDELVGKTALIFKFLSRFQDNNIVIFYFEARPESLESLARRFIGALLYNFLNNSGIDIKEDLDFLLLKTDKFIPKTSHRCRQILLSVQKRKKANIWTELFSLCELIHSETGKYCVAIIDEFHNLENAGISDLYKEWSKILISNKSTMHIIISSMKYKARMILATELSLLFGNFEVLTLEPFDISTTEDYLNHRFKELDIDKGIKDFIIHFTGGCPFYLEVITEAITKSQGVNLSDILEDLLFLPSGILNQRFSNYLKRFQDNAYTQDYSSILYLLASGQNKIKDISHSLHKQKKDLLQRINRLVELDAVTRTGDFFTINDRIFSFWLKFIYQEKLNSMTYDSKNQKALFREKIECMIQEFISNARKPLLERLTDLLQMFEDDMIQINRKKIRLDRFKEIKPLEFKNHSMRNGLIGRSCDSLWIIAFKQDLLTEEDITEFTKECKKYRHKLLRKVIVTSRDVESNARLRALEEKIITWDINNLNQIMDVFDKPRIVL